jgi:HepT-like protein
MSDARWQDIESDVASSVEHFSSAIRIYREPGLHADSPDGYMRRMAFMHAMYAGHTSMERALLRILEIQGEEAPSGRQWHADLIARVGMDVGNRSAVLTTALVKAADRTRKFRHITAHTYDTFDPDDADPAVRAAEKLVAGLAAAITAYRQAIDP